MAQADGRPGVPGPRRMPWRKAAQRWGELLGIALIGLGIFGLVQPWWETGFTNGFSVLLAGTLVFIVASHL